MSPVLASPHSFSLLQAASLPVLLERQGPHSRPATAMELIESVISPEGRDRFGADLARKAEELIDGFPAPERIEHFVLHHADELASLVLPKGNEYDRTVRHAAIAYVLYEAAQRAERGSWCWRTEDRVTRLHCDTHGDVFFGQARFPADAARRDFCDLQFRGFTLPEDSSPLLAATLKYAEYLDLLSIPEIAGYRDVIAAERRHFWGMPSFDREHSWNPIERALLREVEFLGTSPGKLGYFTFSPSRGQYLVRLQEERMEFLRLDDSGEIELAELRGHCASRELFCTKQDIPELMRGLYRTFARNPNTMVAIIEDFVGVAH